MNKDSWSSSPRWDGALSQLSDVRMRIADIVLGVTGLGDDWIWVDRELFQAFMAHDSPDVLLRVHRGRFPKHALENSVAYSVEGLRSVYLSQDKWAFEFNPHDRARFPQRPPHQLLGFDRRFTVGDLYVSEDNASERPTFRLSLFLFELLTNMLPHYDGLMLHASGISDGGRGIVFSGHAGAGKSTLAGLWEGHEGVTLLSDDRCILRKNEGQWWVYPVAGIGELRPTSPEGALLEAVFVVSHAKENVVTRDGISRAATSLLAHISLPPYDAVAIDLGLGLLEDLVKQVPVHELGFAPEEGVVEFIRGAVSGRHVPENSQDGEAVSSSENPERSANYSSPQLNTSRGET